MNTSNQNPDIQKTIYVSPETKLDKKEKTVAKIIKNKTNAKRPIEKP